jgi:predicted ATP-grasp superfamily ATP-dependent carboligase
VFEFICGGGLAGLPLPATMVREGDLMLTALVADLLALPGVRVSYARDVRLALPTRAMPGARVVWRERHMNPTQALAQEIDSSDAVWPIAPESGGELERVARAVLSAGRILLGPGPEAIALAASKFATAKRLAQANIDVVPCFRPESVSEGWPDIGGRWVVKPDDGAGGLGIRVYATRQQAAEAAEHGTGLIAQPWIDADAMSLCVLATLEKVVVLSVNRQLLRMSGDQVELAGIEVNCEPVTAPLTSLAERVAAAIPGLRGYFGIDWIRTASGPHVIEVNPRLTTSFAALRDALGINVAEWVLAAAAGAPRAPNAGELSGNRGRVVRLTWDGDAIG